MLWALHIVKICLATLFSIQHRKEQARIAEKASKQPSEDVSYRTDLLQNDACITQRI